VVGCGGDTEAPLTLVARPSARQSRYTAADAPSNHPNLPTTATTRAWNVHTSQLLWWRRIALRGCCARHEHTRWGRGRGVMSSVDIDLLVLAVVEGEGRSVSLGTEGGGAALNVLDTHRGEVA